MLDFAFRIQHWPGGRWLKPKDKLPPLVAPQKGSEEETIANDERNDQKSSQQRGQERIASSAKRASTRCNRDPGENDLP